MAAAAAVLALGVAACSSPDNGPPSSGGGVFVGLRSAAPTLLQEGQSCDEVLDDFQSFAPLVLRDQFGFATGADGSLFSPTAGAAETADDSTAAPAAEAGRDLVAAGDGDSSDTNTQEEGIDEPDVVENDGSFVYVVDQDELVILDGARGAVVSRLELASHGAQILLQGDRLLAITGGGGYVEGGRGIAVDDVAVTVETSPDGADEEPSGEGSSGEVEPIEVEPIPPEEDPGTEPSPSPSPSPAPEPGPGPIEPPKPEPLPEPLPLPEPGPIDPPEFSVGTVIQLIDVADRAAPRIVQTTEIEGQHVSTRVVDGVARVVVSSWPQPPVMDFPVGIAQDGDAVAVERAIAAELDETTIDDWLPRFRTSIAADDAVAAEAPSTVEGAVVSCEDVLVPEVNAGISETSILRVDFEDGFDPADTTTVVAEAGTVYASAATLYLAATKWVPVIDQQRVVAEDWSTAVHAFDLRGDGAAVHVGAGEVPGSTLNQYSLSEYDGHLRIATTEGTPWGGGSESESGVRVLRLDGDQMVEVGAVTGLGKTETIQSVRFMGPVGYVVTFRQTDPLYVIDLSDPTAPAAVGELKIPGFSSYLHPVGEGRLVGIGRDADLEGQDQGLLVSLFDVSDPTAPKQLQTYTERDAYSSAGSDPKAFLWWAPESAVIVPVERYSPTAQDAGMTLFDVTDSGITERATVRVDQRYPYRAIVVQGRLWSLFDGGAFVSEFSNPAQGGFTGYR